MIRKYFGNLPLWQFENLLNFENVRHFVSGRLGGVSEGELGALNIGFRAIDSRENVIENRNRLAKAIGSESSKLIFPLQMHTDQIQRVDNYTNPESLTNTDGLVTNTKGLFICVMSADCVPILLYDKDNHATAAIHAGWRGTVSKILSKAIDKMVIEFRTKPSSIIACIGPSICSEIYEVGEEVIEAAIQAFGNNEKIIKRGNVEGKGYLDLWEANAIQLKDHGVPEHQIEISGICTYTNNDEFFSARRNKKSGRFGAGIMLL